MNKNVQRAVVIGKASFIDFDNFIKWCLTDEANTFFSIPNLWTGCLYNLQSTVPGINFSNLYDAVKPHNSYDGSGVTCGNRKREYIEPLKNFIHYISAFSSPQTSLKSFSRSTVTPALPIKIFKRLNSFKVRRRSFPSKNAL